jgi:hypothetical protein
MARHGLELVLYDPIAMLMNTMEAMVEIEGLHRRGEGLTCSDRLRVSGTGKPSFLACSSLTVIL